MPDDIQILLDTTGGNNGRQVDPKRLERLPEILLQEVGRASVDVGKQILKNLKMAYAVAIRERPRAEGESLRRRLARAMKMAVTQTPQEVLVGIFDLYEIDRATRNEGKGTEDRGWFFLYEDGHEGLAHGSRSYVFIEYDRAIQLAELCIVEEKIKPAKASQFLAHVRDVFRGRHGEGIMTRIEEPLFYQYPSFGTPRDHGYEHTHQGLEAWNILYTHGSLDDAVRASKYPGQTGEHWAMSHFRQAFDRAAQRMVR